MLAFKRDSSLSCQLPIHFKCLGCNKVTVSVPKRFTENERLVENVIDSEMCGSVRGDGDIEDRHE